VDLDKANTLIRGRGFTTFSSTYCIIATWDKLRYYIRDPAQRDNVNFREENTYQGILCTDGQTGHPIYQYRSMEWSRSQDEETNFATVSSP